MTAAFAAPLSAGPLLQRIAEELVQCQAILSRIEHSVHLSLEGPVVPQAPLSWQKNLQVIDLLEQSLADLALCLSAVADQPAVRAIHNLNEGQVLGPLRLEDLRHRLQGKLACPERADPIEIF
jgi:hypothetical protein